jgi:ribose-phosphate pyrophosphokinase
MRFGDLKVFTGNTHPGLAHAICDYLGQPLGGAEAFEFTNENLFVRILENVREQDVFVVQPISRPVNTSLMELLIFIDALKRASAGRITAVVPYYGYGRSDKKDQPRVPITGRLVADLLTTAGAHRLLTVDFHAGQLQGFFAIPVDELTAEGILARYFAGKELDNLVVVATDVGRAKEARSVGARLHAPVATIDKLRLDNQGHTEVFNVYGDVAGRRALLIDDEIDTGGSMIVAAHALMERGALEVYAAATHPILSGNGPQRLQDSQLKEIVVTDTVSVPLAKRVPKLTVLSIAPLLGEAIHRIYSGRSVGELFEPDYDLGELYKRHED